MKSQVQSSCFVVIGLCLHLVPFLRILEKAAARIVPRSRKTDSSSSEGTCKVVVEASIIILKRPRPLFAQFIVAFRLFFTRRS